LGSFAVGEEGHVLEESEDRQDIIERVAALDIGKATLVCCTRVPHPDKPGRRMQEVTTYRTMTRDLLRLADRLRGLGVTRVVMEATSDYWKPVFYLLEGAGLEPWLVNAHDVKHLPGRPKTDRIDAVWLCKLAERQMLRPSFVPPVEIRRLRDLTRYRVDLVVAQSAEKNRVEKLLEDAQIKLSVVASDIFGVSGRAMLAALIAGRRDPVELAQLAKAGLRRKLDDLQEALTGYFNEHHAYLLTKMLSRIDAIQADIDDLDAQIEVYIGPFAQTAARLEQIPGIGRIAAHAIIAEIGVDMARFPTGAHLSSWARFSPKVKESAGRKKGTSATGHGNPYLARTLGHVAASAGRTQTFLGERYRRISRRRGPQRAIVAIGRSVLVIVWHLLSDAEATYQDLGVTFYDTRINPERRARHHIRQLESLGYDVTATRTLPAAA
jgi:transposase